MFLTLKVTGGTHWHRGKALGAGDTFEGSERMLAANPDRFEAVGGPYAEAKEPFVSISKPRRRRGKLVVDVVTPDVESVVEKVAAKVSDEASTEEDEKTALQAEAESLGIDVDGRWGIDRLKQEIANANTSDDE